MNLEEKFIRARKFKEKNYGKMVQLQKRYFDEWAQEQFRKKGHVQFKLSYMAFLMNIDEHGISNKELAAKVHVTKQAMSKGMKDLEKLGLVESKTHEEDARVSVISLTDKGKEIVVDVVESVCGKMTEYEALVGKENFHQAMDIMFVILEYEKAKLAGKKFKSKII